MDGSILIMDYSLYERQKIKHILEKVGSFDVIEVSSINQFKLFNLEAGNLRLAIVDLAFPTETGGFEALKILKSSRTARNYPVIAITQSDKPELKVEASQYSLNDYIIKPYQVRRLESSIKSLVTRKESFIFDTRTLGSITMSFDEYITREMKFSKRTQSPLSFIFITTLKIKQNNNEIMEDETVGKENIFPIAAEKARKSLRATDTIFLSRERDILIILPATGEAGAKQVCDKINLQILRELRKINADLNDYIYPVHFSYPGDGENFQALMETALRKVSDKEMLEKILLIPLKTINNAKKCYNVYRRW